MGSNRLPALRRPMLVTVTGIVALMTACSAGAKPSATAPQASSVSRPMTPAAIGAYQGADRQQMLEDGARQEGTVTWYTGLVGDVQDGIVKGFQAKYPGIKVNAVRADPTAILTRISEEAKAHKTDFDVVDTDSWDSGLVLLDEKVTAPYYSAPVTGYPADAKNPAQNGLVYWAVAETECNGFAYNTNLIPSSAVPKTYQDLLNPALKGKMAIVGSSTGTYFIGNVLTNQGEPYAEQLSKQAMQVQQISAKALSDLIVSGEVAASPTIFEPHILQDLAKGAPVKWIGLEPATCTGGGWALDATAPHPHAAMLFLDYVFGTEAQKLYQSLGYRPAGGAGAAGAVKTWNPGQFKTVGEYQQKFTQWQDFFNKWFIQK